MGCNHAAAGCNYPEGECAGNCAPSRPALRTVSAAEKMEAAHKGKTVSEIWPCGQGLEIVFNDGSSLIILPPFVFKPAPAAKSGG